MLGSQRDLPDYVPDTTDRALAGMCLPPQACKLKLSYGLRQNESLQNLGSLLVHVLI